MKRQKIDQNKGEVFTFKSKTDKPELKELKIEPKEYFKYQKAQGKHLADKFSNGQIGAGFTSTRMEHVTDQRNLELSNDELRKPYLNIIKSKQLKGQVTLVTS